MSADDLPVLADRPGGTFLSIEINYYAEGFLKLLGKEAFVNKGIPSL